MSRSSSQTPLPARLGPYRVLGRLGAGGMGVVYRAVHEDTGQPVALKTVHALDPADLASLRREVHALSRLAHPHVVRVLDQGVTEGVPWCAMELVEGRTLRAMLSDVYGAAPSASQEAARPRAGSITPLLRALVDVCAALSHLHASGIVHRDLKPENVLVRPDGRAVLVDFGIASGFTSGHESLQNLVRSSGTVLYMSPEQVRGQVVDPRSDLYALGCMLYECLVGEVPFLALDVMVVAWRQMSVVPPSPLARGADAPASLDRLAMRLLEKRPQDRPGYADVVAAELRRALGDDAPAAAPPVYLYRPQLVGRGDALRQVNDRVRQAREGRGSMLLVSGESGVGKTRLALEAAAMATSLGVHVLSGACVALDPDRRGDVRAAPLHPLDALFTLVTDLCLADEARVDRLLAGRGRVLAEFHPRLLEVTAVRRASMPPSLPLRAARDRALEAACDVLFALSDDDPVVLVLDDLQWADELTTELLARLAAGGLAGRHLVVLGLFRAEETPPALDALTASPGVDTLRLPRLDRAATGQMVRDMLAMAEAPAALADYVFDQADGNPFFVAEYLRAAAEERVLSRDAAGRWGLTARAQPHDDDVLRVRDPERVVGLLQRRLAGLSQQATAVLRAAAVLGRELDPAVLADVAGLDETSLLGGLDDLRAREILEGGRGPALRFVHDRLREVAWSVTPDDARRRLHRRAADVLAARPESPTGHSLLALHLDRAGDPRAAAARYALAGDHARRTWAAREAIEHYRAALDAWSRALRDDPRPHDDAVAGVTVPALREATADLLALTGRESEAREALDRALDEVDPARVAWRARLSSKRAKTFETQHQHAEALRAYEAAMATLGDAPPAGDARVGAPDQPVDPTAAWWEAWLHVQVERVWVHYWLAEPDAMRALVERVRPVMEARGTPAQRARFYQAVVHSDLRAGRYRIDAGTVADAGRMLAAALETADPTVVAYARLGHGMVSLFDGRVVEAAATLGAALDDTQLTGDLVTRLRCLTYLTVALRLAGDVAAVRARAAEVLALATRLRMDDYRGAAQAALAWAAWREGDRDGAARACDEALALWTALAVKYAYPLGWLARTVALAGMEGGGALEAARAHAVAMLDAGQVRLPDALEADLARLVDAPSAEALSRALSTARGLGYL